MEIIDTVLERIGLGNPNVRMVVFAAGSAGAIILTKPRLFFTESGRAKQSVLLGANSDDPNSNYLPWWWIPISIGILAAAY